MILFVGRAAKFDLFRAELTNNFRKRGGLDVLMPVAEIRPIEFQNQRAAPIRSLAFWPVDGRPHPVSGSMVQGPPRSPSLLRLWICGYFYCWLLLDGSWWIWTQIGLEKIQFPSLIISLNIFFFNFNHLSTHLHSAVASYTTGHNIF